MPSKSIYFSDDLLERVDAARKADKRSLSGWVTVQLAAAVREVPVVPAVVKRYDENQAKKGKT